MWFCKDSPHLTSAYSKIADELILKRLSKHHTVALFATVGYDIGCLESEGVIFYPKLGEMNGEDIFLSHCKDFGADLYITACDVWIFNKLPQSAAKGDVLWVPWAYIDFKPQRVDAEFLSPAIKVVPTSKWLESQLTGLGLENVSAPIFLGVNQNVYRPWVGEIDSEEGEVTKERLRRSLGFPEDSRVIGMVQMNQLWRKPYDEQFQGIQIFRENNPDIDVRVYCHALPRVSNGWSLPELALEHGMNYLKGEIKFADEYTTLKGLMGYNEDHMAKIYNAMDVLLQCTSGESPGMPIFEAQSCGIPVVGTAYTCMPEFIKAGYCVKPLKYFHSPSVPRIKKALPDPYDIADKLEKVLNSDPEYWLKMGPEAMKEYTWENCLQGWLTLLNEIEGKIANRCLKVPVPSKSLQALAQETMMLE